MKSRKTRIGIFVVFALQCRVECRSVAIFIIHVCSSGKYSSETIEKLTFSYRFLYCEKQFRYLSSFACYPKLAHALNFHAVLNSAELPFCLFSILWPHFLSVDCNAKYVNFTGLQLASKEIASYTKNLCCWEIYRAACSENV